MDKRVLLIEDDETNSEIISLFLMQAGWEHTTCIGFVVEQRGAPPLRAPFCGALAPGIRVHCAQTTVSTADMALAMLTTGGCRTNATLFRIHGQSQVTGPISEPLCQARPEAAPAD